MKMEKQTRELIDELGKYNVDLVRSRSEVEIVELLMRARSELRRIAPEETNLNFPEFEAEW